MPRTNPARFTDPLRGTRTRVETGRLVGCGVLKIDSLIRNGDLDAIIVGNRRLITVPSIERLLGRPISEMEVSLQSPGAARAAAA